jgi:lysozyme family protein
VSVSIRLFLVGEQMNAKEMFKLAWKQTHEIEGGYTTGSYAGDPETNHGITAPVARAHGYAGPMRELSVEMAESIAKVEYWDKLHLDDIAAMSGEIAFELFDTNFNMWAGAAGKFLQRALNALNQEGRDYPDVSVDGVIGTKTVQALRLYLNKYGTQGEHVMLVCLNAQQCTDYLRQAAETTGKEKVFRGWVLNRVKI